MDMTIFVNRRRLRMLFSIALIAITCLLSVSSKPTQAQQDQEKNQSKSEKILAQQKILAERYRLLEEKLFSLYEFERDSNPMRSKLLERAYLQSQERMTTTQLQTVVKLIEAGRLRDAQPGQNRVLKELQALLELLESEDRGKRVRDDIRRHQEYLKEVNRILRIQKGIRGQTEGGSDTRRLSNSQENAANRTDKLAKDIQRNEEPESTDGKNENSDSKNGSESQNGSNGKSGNSGSDSSNKNEDQNSNDKSGDKKSTNNDPDEDKGDTDKKSANGKPNSENENSDQPKKSNDKNEPPEGQGKSGDGKPGKGQSGQPGEQGESGDQEQQSDDGQQGNQQQQNPVRKRLQAAEKKMRDAQQKLEKARRADSIKDMQAAEREMALAKKELEEILRQLREEEIERTLAMLEGRFRKMLEQQIRVYEGTRKLDRTPPDKRGTDFEISAGKLSTQQNAIATEAARALMLLREDGSSVAFPETVEQMHLDMLQVASRLSAAKIGRITVEIEEDIIDTLDYLIEALVQTQQDMEAMKQQQQQQQQQGRPGDRPLVDQLAEIKMLRGLQERIYRRHKRYSNLLEDPDDPVGIAEDPDLQSALSRLAQKQKQLAEIARDIVQGKNK